MTEQPVGMPTSEDCRTWEVSFRPAPEGLDEELVAPGQWRPVFIGAGGFELVHVFTSRIASG
jgi:hypothetical protein